MKPPPPGPVSGLSHTQDTKAAATQASTAVPPASSTLAPASAVSGCPAAIAPFTRRSRFKAITGAHRANSGRRYTSEPLEGQVVNSMFDQISTRIGRRGFAAAGVLLLVLLAAVATPQILGTRVAQALHTFGDADPKWLWLAGLGFAASLFGAAASWRCAIGICGGRVSMTDACANYGAGSLVNTLVPARAGDAVRIGLFARALPNRERLWTTGGAFAALSAAKAGVLGAFVVAGAISGVVPLWPLLVALALVAAAVGL